MELNKEKDKKTIIYVGSVEVPSASAASRRILGNAKAIQHAGYNVLIGGAQEGSQDYINHEGIDIYQTGERKYENLPTLLKYLAYARMGKLTVNWLESLECNIAAVVLYSGYSPYLLRLLPWCKKNGIPLVFDAVEWYEAPSKLQAIFNPYYWNIEYAMQRLIPKTKNVICISSYLQKYFDKNCQTVILPPLLSVDEVSTKQISEGIVVSYTGSPGKKDLLDNCLDAVINFNLRNVNNQISFHIAGLTNNDLLKYPSVAKQNWTKLPEYIKAFGFVSIEKSLELTRASHFSLLLRPQNRVSNAGFPTKVVESLSEGTPVILNITSDLANYIHDKKEGFICENHSTESLEKALEKVLVLDNTQYNEMSNSAVKRAKESFEYTTYKNEIQTFFNNLIL